MGTVTILVSKIERIEWCDECEEAGTECTHDKQDIGFIEAYCE